MVVVPFTREGRSQAHVDNLRSQHSVEQGCKSVHYRGGYRLQPRVQDPQKRWMPGERPKVRIGFQRRFREPEAGRVTDKRTLVTAPETSSVLPIRRPSMKPSSHFFEDAAPRSDGNFCRADADAAVPRPDRRRRRLGRLRRRCRHDEPSHRDDPDLPREPGRARNPRRRPWLVSGITKPRAGQRPINSEVVQRIFGAVASSLPPPVTTAIFPASSHARALPLGLPLELEHALPAAPMIETTAAPECPLG